MYHFKGKKVDFKFHGINISKKLGQGHVYHCVASPLLFITVCKRLGTEETSFSSLGIGMLSHSCLIQASSCSTVLGLLCRIFLFMMHQMFSMGERSGLQTGHFSTRILLLHSNDVVIDAVCAKAHLKWTVAKWKTVLRSDESKFEVLFRKLGHHVIRTKEDKDNPSCYQHSVQKPASLMVWGCMSACGMGSLHIWKGTINAERYIQVLEQHMLLSRRRLFQGRPCIFQHDNARPHTASITTSWPVEEGSWY
uniref:Transposase n=1 Tax=Cyprinus carpio carpio TaxID=630221 RepID=A0A9J7X4R8_CYPCA